MHKIFLVFNLLVSVFRVNYVSIDYIDCYSNYQEKIKFDFSFISDSVSSHSLFVVIELYDSGNRKLVEYSNTLNIIGDKKISANIDYLYKEGLYALISVRCDQKEIVSYIRFDFYKSQSCQINKIDRVCNSFYKNRYKDNVVTDKYMNMQILKAPFDSFLTYNRLDLSEFYIYSEYDFSDDEIYLLIEDELDGYNINFTNNYRIPLNVIREGNYYKLTPLEFYYLSVYPFEFSEEYKENYFKTNQIYFPFNNEYKEYDLLIIIEGVNLIEILFTISVSDTLFGECEMSKYCLERVSYD